MNDFGPTAKFVSICGKSLTEGSRATTVISFPSYGETSPSQALWIDTGKPCLEDDWKDRSLEQGKKYRRALQLHLWKFNHQDDHLAMHVHGRSPNKRAGGISKLTHSVRLDCNKPNISNPKSSEAY